MEQQRGLFITFEGCEGCGKSTQAALLHRRLMEGKTPCVLTQEPGGTPLGERVRDLLKVKREFSISPLAELLLFNACRAQLVLDVVRPALDDGKVVICDRFSDSTTVYQGYGRGIDIALTGRVNELAAGGLKPALTVLLDMPAQTGLQRKIGRHSDRFEAEDLAFHERIRRGYLELAAKEPARWLILPADKDMNVISSQIWQHVEQLLRDRQLLP
jgi:dTMP kinase